jgi:hypothetical protein
MTIEVFGCSFMKVLPSNGFALWRAANDFTTLYVDYGSY